MARRSTPCMKKLNELDLKILRRLTTNARVPLRDVAEGENSSRSSVNQRLTRMIENGVLTSLKYHVNPKKIGYNTCTYVGGATGAWLSLQGGRRANA